MMDLMMDLMMELLGILVQACMRIHNLHASGFLELSEKIPFLDSAMACP